MNDTMKALLIAAGLLFAAFGGVGLALMGYPAGPEPAWDGR